MNTENLRKIIRDTVQEVRETRSDRPCLLSMRDLSALTDIPMRTMKHYEDQGALKRETVMGLELVDVKAFRDWCLENLTGKRKSKTVGRLDLYINEYKS